MLHLELYPMDKVKPVLGFEDYMRDPTEYLINAEGAVQTIQYDKYKPE